MSTAAATGPLEDRGQSSLDVVQVPTVGQAVVVDPMQEVQAAPEGDDAPRHLVGRDGHLDLLSEGSEDQRQEPGQQHEE